MLFESSPEVGIGYILEVIPELGQKVSAAEHLGSCSRCE
jgi:hypothetical protein